MVESTEKKEYKPASKDEEEHIELLNLKSKQRASPFLNKQRSWQDEDHFSIPAELMKGITEELGFLIPSYIQGVAIPMIVREHEGDFINLIAQSKNGSGKTGAFTIGSALRVDPKINKPQVIAICHIRELSSQIADVYKKVCKFSDITVSDFTATNNANAHILVTTLGQL
jgi:superfamily II DNA/RNA helicase